MEDPGFGSPWHLGPVPSVNDACLDAALAAYVGSVPEEQCFDLLSYNNMARQKAANGVDLVRLEPLLQPLLAVQPSGRFKPKQLQHSIHRLVCHQPALNRSSFNAKMFATWLSTQILVALTHLRRLRHNQVRYREATGRMAASDRVALDRVLGYLSAPGGDCPTTASGAATPPPKRARRQLQPHVSVDSEGFPDLAKVLCDEVAKPSEDANDSGSDPELHQLAQALLDFSVPAHAPAQPAHDLRKSAEEVAATAPVPARRGAMRQAALKKRPAATKALTERVAENPVLGKLRLTVATKKAYICAFDDTSNKWVHIVSIYDKVPDFAELGMKLLRYAGAHECDKEALIAIKNRWTQELDEGKDWKDLDSSASEASAQ